MHVLKRFITTSVAALLLLLLTTPLATAELDPAGLVFYLACEDAANPVDLSNDPTTIKVHGALGLAPGQFGTMGLEFPGTSANRLEVADAPKLDGMAALTIEAWIRPRNVAGHEGMSVASKRIANQNADSYNLFIWTGRIVNARVNANGTNAVTSTTALQDDTWYHLAFVFDGQAAAGEKVKLYVNGVMEDVDTHPSAVVNPGDAPVWIGELDAARGFAWDGVLDEIGIWNVALTQGDISDLIAVGKGAIFSSNQALGPKPADGAMIDKTWATLSWRPGTAAVSHDVYFGQDADAVAAATPESADVYVGRRQVATLNVGLPGGPAPQGLESGRIYYWRVDEINPAEPDSPWQGEVWSFQVQPATAWNPVPPDGMRFVDPNQNLSWSAGLGSAFHTVFFGKSFDEVNTAVAGTMAADPKYEPGPLDLATTYYWRVDEFAFPANVTHKGTVWSFTTIGPGGGVKAEYFSGTLLAGDPILTQTEDSINHNWTAEVAGGLADQVSIRWTADLEVPLDGTYTLITTSDDGVRLWLDGVLVINNWTNHSATDNRATVDLQAGEVYSLKMEFYEDGGSAVAQLSWQSPVIPRQIIPRGALQLPRHAGDPSPGHGEVGVSQAATLNWRAGNGTTRHQVYFGDNAETVANATAPDATQAADDTAYDAGALAWGKTYYWRIDEVQSDGSVLKGKVWSFTTADFLVVDDFEGYTDEEGGRVFDSWADGWDNPANGSVVGHAQAPFAEQTIVRSGRQSMPLAYDNSAAPSSEAARTFTPAQNWTVEGVTTLVVHFRGVAGNTGQLYAKVNGTKIPYTGDAVDIASTQWKEWKIDLAAAGVSAASVTTLTIGVEGGQTGTLYIDDIRVARP